MIANVGLGRWAC